MSKASILLVSDNHDTLSSLEKALDSMDVNLVSAKATPKDQDFAVIVLDFPSTLDIATQIPIIVLVDSENIEALPDGATDRASIRRHRGHG